MIMKTSKKLLSFFLAVVMVISSCSVGFVAFAKDDNDMNRNYWNDATSADDAFAALENLVNEYLPKLYDMQISNPDGTTTTLGQTIGTALNMTITPNTKLQDLVGGVSPLLVSALASANEKDILPNYDSMSKYKYGYLNGDGSSAMSFYQLYRFCTVIDGAIIDEGKPGAPTDANLISLDKYAKATKAELDKLMNLYTAEEEKMGELWSSTDFKNSMNAAMEIYMAVAGATGLEIISPEYMDTVTISYKGEDTLVKNIPFSDVKLFFDAYIDFESLGIANKHYPKSTSEAIYYSLMIYEGLSDAVQPDFMQCMKSLRLITDAGKKVSAAKAGATNGESFDINDWETVLEKVYPLSKYVAEHQDSLGTAAAGYEEAEKNSKYKLYILELLGNCLYDYVDFSAIDPEDPDYPLDLKQRLDFNSSYYNDECYALLKSINPNVDINSQLITDEQILAIANIAATNDWRNDFPLNDYVNNEACILSNPAKEAYLALDNAYDRIALAEAFTQLGKDVIAANGDQAKINQALATFKAVKAPNDKTAVVCDMGFIDRFNYLIPSLMVLNEYPDHVYGASSENGSEYHYADVSAIIEEINMYKKISNKIVADNNGYDYNKYKTAQLEDGSTVELTDAMMVDAVNILINSKINEFFGPDFAVPLNDIVNSLLSTNVDLKETLTDLWKSLYNDPIGTIFKLAPLLTILIDELIVPIVFTENDTHTALGFNQILVNMLFNPEVSGIGAPLFNMTIAGGNTDVGIATQLNSEDVMMFAFDLNKMIPGILDYILNVPNSSYVAALGTYEGLIPGGENVPRFLNIYAADKAVADVVIGDKLINLVSTNLYNTALNGATANGGTVTAEQKAQMKADADMKANGINEIVTNVGTTLNTAVHAYFDDIATRDNDPRHMKDGNEIVVSQHGLNNLFVALPQMLDFIGKEILDKYAIKGSDWSATYPGKIIDVTVDGTINGQPATATDKRNSTNEDFKQLVTTTNSANILEQVLTIAIGNWLNGLLDFVNDIVSDDSAENKIVNELPLVFGLLDAIGGLGEKSIVSDIVDGLFQMKRSDANSFAITKQPTTNFVGFTNNAGRFLISNLQFEKDGEQKGIIPLVMNLVNANKQPAPAAQQNAAPADTATQAPIAINPIGAAPSVATDYDALLSNKNINGANDLISKLDKVLSTLLNDITVNGKNITDVSNFATDIVTMLTPALGEQNATSLVNNVIGEYLTIVANETYDNDTLSTFVVNTYALIENIIDYMFYEKANAPLAVDTDKLIADAITGIISPDSVAVRMTAGTYDKTIKELSKTDYLRWSDFKADLGDNKSNILKFNVNTEDEFFNAMAESFGGITAIFGAILSKAVTENSTDNNVENLYSEVYYPLIGSILDGVMDPSIYNSKNTNDAQKLVGSFIKPVNNLIKSLFAVPNQPAQELIKLVGRIGSALQDENLRQIVKGLISIVNDEIGGFTNIVGNLSTTFQNELKNAIDNATFVINGTNYTIPSFENKILSYVQNGDIAISLINGIFAAKGIAPGAIIQLPAADFVKLNEVKDNAGSVLLLVFNYVIKTVTTDSVLQLLLQAKYPGIRDLLKSLTATQIIDILNQIIGEIQDPTEIYWAFTEYANNLLGKFTYPQGILPQDATNAVAQLDNIVKNIFPLLKELGVLNADSLADVLNDIAFTNANLTALAKGLYGALNNKIANTTMTIGDITKAFSIDPTPAGVAGYLTDRSYGATFSSAAQTLNSVNSWNDVTSINWGYTDGSSMAQQGFVNGLAAILRPFDSILAMLLVGDQLTVDEEGLVAIITAIDATFSETAKMANGVITITSNGTTVEIPLANTARELAKLLNEGKIHLGSNGYESAIVPLLEALTVTGFKTYNNYVADYRIAKDNILLNILNPLFGFVNKVVDAPFDTLTAALPNIALFIDGYGISQFLNNLLGSIVSDNGIVGILNANGINVDSIIAEIIGMDLGAFIESKIGSNAGLKLELNNLEKCNIHEVLIPIVNTLLAKQGIVLENIDWKQLASHGELTTVASAAKNADGKFTSRQIVNVNKGETLIAVLRYISSTLINNAKAINKLIAGIPAIAKNGTLKSILGCIFDQVSLAQKDDIIRAIFFFLLDEGDNAYFDYTGFTYENFEFSFGNMDEDFCRQLGPMLDGLVGGMLNLNDMISEMLYKDEMISTIATGLYKAVEGVNISKEIGSLTHLLSLTGIDFTTTNVANLLVDEAYGQSYADAASAIKSAGSWANVKAENLKWGVTDRDSFLHALAAVLRPVYGVLDVLLNNGSLNIFNLISIPGSDGYTSFLVPLMEAFGLYNIKTQYQYREDIFTEYDNILLDVLNPLLDKVEDILAAPIETLTDILPNLALVFANGGLLQIINNLLTPVSAILNAIRPIVDANKLLDALNVDIAGLLAKIGVKGNVVVDVYDLPGTLTPLLGATSVTDFLNGILGTIKIGGAPLGVVLPQINWYQLASHGEVILDGTSQVACHGMRISIQADQDETLIALLRFLVNTVNYENNYNAICDLVGGLIGGADASVSDIVGQVLGMLQGDADAVIEDIVSLLQDLAG